MTLWGFQNIQAGWRKANGSESGPKAPTDEEREAVVARLGHLLN